jgi:hypothetical protein
VKLRTTFLSVALAIAAWLPATRSEAQPESITPRASTDRPELMWRFELGYRGSFVTSPGYNAFSTQDYMAQVSMMASRTLFARGHYSFASGIGWDYGGSGATARGDMTSLTMHRLNVPLEGRVHFGRWGYGFLRAAPGVAVVSTQIEDASAPPSTGTTQQLLSKSRWLFAADASAGYAWLAWSGTPSSAGTPRLWLQADGGYGWVADERLNLAPNVGGDQRVAGIDLGPLSMQGGFFRIAAAFSY